MRLLLCSRGHEGSLVLFNLFDLTSEIDLGGRGPLCLLDQLPSNEQNGEKANHEVTEDEGRDIPLARQENCVSADEGHDRATDKAIPSEVRLTPPLERKAVAVKALGVASTLPADESHTHDGVVDQLRSSNQVDEPLEHCSSVRADLQESEQSDTEHNNGAVDGDTTASGASENLRRLAFECKSIERTRGAIDITVTS